MSLPQVKKNLEYVLEILSKLSDDDKTYAADVLRREVRSDVDWYGLFCCLENLAFFNWLYGFGKKLSEDLEKKLSKDL